MWGSDPYDHLQCPNDYPGLDVRLKAHGLLDGLDPADAKQVASAVVRALVEIPMGWDGTYGPCQKANARVDPRNAANALRQQAANVGCGSDVRHWHDRTAASNAFATAADLAAAVMLPGAVDVC